MKIKEDSEMISFECVFVTIEIRDEGVRMKVVIVKMER